MNLLFVSGSPKVTDSATLAILDRLEAGLAGSGTLRRVRAIAAKAPSPEDLEAEVLVLALPLYVDSLPAPLLEWLVSYKDLVQKRQAADPSWKPGAKVYAVVNCGFHEGIQNEHALAIIQNFAASTGLAYGGGLGIGTGGMVLAMAKVPDQAGIKRPVAQGLDWLTGLIRDGALPGTNRYVQFGFPRFAYLLAAHAGWRRLAKGNGVPSRRLLDRP